jgi:hypothetical protein
MLSRSEPLEAIGAESVSLCCVLSVSHRGRHGRSESGVATADGR